MQVLSKIYQQFLFPRELVTAHYHQKVPCDFQEGLIQGAWEQPMGGRLGHPKLYTAQRPEVIKWLHGLKNPDILQEKPCITPLLLYDKALSFDRVLFHYEGNPQSAQLIRHF